MKLTKRLRVEPGSIADLSVIDPDATPGFDGDRDDAEDALEKLSPKLAQVQEQLFADGYVGGDRSLLVVIQGMDTSGKGGTLKRCVGILNPGGIHIKSFKRPSEEERKHDFLWRVEREVPQHGYVGIFDRSHYEDVLIQRVHQMAPAREIERRYGAINDFERRLTEEGVTIVKCMLHISPEEQRDRLNDRLDDPTKQWKYKPGDVDERLLWNDYQQAYEIALTRCSTEAAPWHVIPANKKWYRDWAVSTLMFDALKGLDLDWPEPTYDVDVERRRVRDS